MWAGLRGGCPGRLSADVEEGVVGAARGAAWGPCSERGARRGRNWPIPPVRGHVVWPGRDHV